MDKKKSGNGNGNKKKSGSKKQSLKKQKQANVITAEEKIEQRRSFEYEQLDFHELFELYREYRRENNINGRELRLTPRVRDIIIESVRNGNFMSTSAELAGVSLTRFWEWMKEGKDKIEGHGRYYADGKDLLYMLFYMDVRQAQAEAEATAVDAIVEAGRESWQAWAWWLERTRPDKFGKRETVDQNVNANVKAEIRAGWVDEIPEAEEDEREVQYVERQRQEAIEDKEQA